MTTLVLLLLALLLVSVWLGFYALVKQQGRILLRLDQLEQSPRLAVPGSESLVQQAEPEGLPLAADFPAFKFPDLTGKTVGLEDFRGKRGLLVHWNFECGFCNALAPELARLGPDFEKRNVQPVLLTYGDAASNQKGAAEHGMKCPILLMKNDETPKPFEHRGTPVAYLLDEEGRVASPIANGADRVLSLAQAASGGTGGSDVRHGQPEHSGLPGEAHEPHRVHLPGFLARQEIGLGDVIKRVTAAFGIKPCVGCERRAAWLNRWLVFSGATGGGLKAGKPAPGFRLPDLQGRMVALEEYRGRRVLLVFTDPQCGPCDELAPHLVRLHREHASNGLAVILVGRGNAEENRRKAEQHGFQFPVVIQPKWKLAKEYGTFATPVAFLVGEDGVIVRDVAVGRDPILALARAGARKAA